MNDILIALSIGTVAGIIDIIPMIIQKLDKYANLSAFFHWLFLGLIIPFISWQITPWFKGFIIAELSTIPLLFIIVQKDKKVIIPIILISAILGSSIGVAGNFFIN